MICVFSDSGMCLRHRSFHRGAAMELALDPGEAGEKARREWDRALRMKRTRKRPKIASGACVHLGGPTGKEVDCKTCSGSTRLKTFVCTVHGACTIDRKSGSAASCKGCKDFASVESCSPYGVSSKIG